MVEMLLVVLLIILFFWMKVCRICLIKFFDVLNPITYDFFRTIIVFFFNMFVFDMMMNNYVLDSSKYWFDCCVKVSRCLVPRSNSKLFCFFLFAVGNILINEWYPFKYFGLGRDYGKFMNPSNLNLKYF